MRTSLLCSLSLVVVASSCGRAELPEPPFEAVEPAPSPIVASSRVRLNSNFDSSDGFRFSDGKVLTTTTTGARCPVTEVRGADGALLEGDAARVDVQSHSRRFLTLLVPGGSLCVVNRRVLSLADVDANDCEDWKPLEMLHLSFQPRENAMGTGLFVRTEPGRGYRMWIAESGFDALAGVNYAIIDFDQQPGLATCSIENEACVERDDCCNSRHSCIAGVCQY